MELEGLKPGPNGVLVQNFYRAGIGKASFLVDEETLEAVSTEAPITPYPIELDAVESDTPEMQVRWFQGTGPGGDPDVIYMLRWETLPSNRDLPRATIPPPTPLRLFTFPRR